MDGIFGQGTNRRIPSPPSGHNGLLTLVKGVMVGIGGIYLLTFSVAVTVIAAVAAVLLVGLSLMLNR